MPDLVLAIVTGWLLGCLLAISRGVYLALKGKAHECACRGDHLLAIIRWRDEADASEVEEA